MEVLKLQNISKNIGKNKIIKDLSLTINQGEIFGFLGPNGAGKTTTIKMIVGFLKPTSGKIYVYGRDILQHRIESIKNMAAMVESPDMYPYLTGLENLKQLARLDRNIDENNIINALEEVGLKDKMNQKFKTYSMGMKQRLAIAQVLLGNKKLWLLDEPTNGLDPSGIIHFRNLFKKYASKRGVTIFISSHILGEMEVLCDKIAFIKDGRIKGIQDMCKLHGKLEDRYIELIGGDIDDFQHN
ncbi:MAG: ABC transporter ATP-binding protein [Clostridium luticellarii]|jgi:ABC-2 type transport system ATP-binding protein|uniref:ABC transporter ATP-binding protein n=1 Tax=Clostridium luticellarii TaxID=1691940 RepID=UPI0023578257|nr:ABC transporter ATP-binding protein [Clostridium luticellarii]MCI2039513.1 ABC transporter ATP-binding protein [Clostridium luticellarii]